MPRSSNEIIEELSIFAGYPWVGERQAAYGPRKPRPAIGGE
jgi:hypothetical protein